MTKSEFVAECQKRTVDPAVALESENIRAALAKRDDDAVVRILDEEF